jgi:hypothetical protein
VIAAELIKRGAKYFAKDTAVIFKDQILTFEEVHTVLFTTGIE